MTSRPIFTRYAAQLRAFIDLSLASPQTGGTNHTQAESQFNTLAATLFALQFEHNPVYQKLCCARNITPDKLLHWTQIPTLPTAAFKEFDISSLTPADRSTVFYSSGTTAQKASRHFHNRESLELYEYSLRPWFRTHVLPDFAPGDLTLLCLTPSPAQAPHSSLVHMLDTLRRTDGAADSEFTGRLGDQGVWEIDFDKTLDILNSHGSESKPIGLLGTAFSFVHLLEQLAEKSLRFSLPSGSRVVETGGYKGQSRALPQRELHEWITRQLGIPATHILCEYGMSELSSQAYDRKVIDLSRSRRIFHFPPWARARVLAPENAHDCAEGEAGLLHICDLANMRSVMALQTGDLALRRDSGFELIGRAPTSEPRGCSLQST